MDGIVVIISTIGLAGALVFNIYLSYRERKELHILNKSKDVSEFEYIVKDTKEEEEEEGSGLVDIDQMPDLYAGKK